MLNNYKTSFTFADMVAIKSCCACDRIRKYRDVFCCDYQPECVSLNGSCERFVESIHTFIEFISETQDA